jgi:serine/threonine protein kinase
MPDLGALGYRVYKHLGTGAFGEVWLAQDLNLWRVLALKTFDLRSAPNGNAPALEALRNDARLLAEIDHPNVVRVYAWHTIRDQHYLALQYVAGGSLADRLKKEGPLDWELAARYVADVGEGLLAVHARGIVHRDIKPANILWDRGKDEAMLTDFGVAARLTDPAAIAGSLPYMALEAFDGAVAPSLDVYSLASTLFHLATGSAPFPGRSISELKQQIPRGLPDVDLGCIGLPGPLEDVIRAGLTADAEKRPPMSEFVSTLRATLNQLLAGTLTMFRPVPEQPAPSAPPAPAPVDLRLIVSHQVGPGMFVPVAATHPQEPPSRITRDMKKVPPAPDQVRLRTGDRVRIEVVADRHGYLTVFNVGPTGNLNLLHPDDAGGLAAPSLVSAHRPLHVVDVEMMAPAGRERLFAVWSKRPLALAQLASLGDHGPTKASRPYRATRDMKRVKDVVGQFRPEDGGVVVVEVEHVA